MDWLSEHLLCQNILKFLGIRLGLRFCVRLTWICWNTVKYYWIKNCSFFLTEWNCWPITPWLGEEKRRVTPLSQSEKKINSAWKVSKFRACFGLYFHLSGQNKQSCRVNIPIHFEMGKYRPEKTPYSDML